MGLVRRAAAPEAPGPETPTTESLLAALTADDAEERRRAALGLDGVAEAVPALLARVGAEPDPAVRDAVLTTLAAVDREDVATGLAVHLASEDAALRTAVAETLAAMPTAVPGLLPGLLADPDHDVRIMTVMILADLVHPDSVPRLVEVIRTDPHPNVVAAAVDALLPSATEDHAAVLREARARFPDDPFLRFTVEAALPGLPGGEA